MMTLKIAGISAMATAAPETRLPPFELIAGNVCLDFVNTLDNRPSGEPKELIGSFLDLARFAQESGILPAKDGKYLVGRLNFHRAEAETALRRALELREVMYAVFSAVLRRKSSPPAALATLNAHIRDSAEHSRLVPVGKGYEWRFDDLKSAYDALLWPIARAAAELLASGDLAMVRACSEATCQWFFLDTSKNHHRRWCSMKICGNRTKVRKFYARKKTA
ncbi:MAG: ABATE domain-containing protein [Candidatus Sulfotelmatobacter sp.]|jgi:predicted RNA-binding Zn ribbon-like protein